MLIQKYLGKICIECFCGRGLPLSFTRKESFKLAETHTSSCFVFFVSCWKSIRLALLFTSMWIGMNLPSGSPGPPQAPSQTAFTLTPWVHNRSMHASIMWQRCLNWLVPSPIHALLLLHQEQALGTNSRLESWS